MDESTQLLYFFVLYFPPTFRHSCEQYASNKFTTNSYDPNYHDMIVDISM